MTQMSSVSRLLRLPTVLSRRDDGSGDLHQTGQCRRDTCTERIHGQASALNAVGKRPLNSQGLESFCTNATAAACAGTETTAVQTHGNCSNFYGGFLPAVSIGAL